MSLDNGNNRIVEWEQPYVLSLMIFVKSLNFNHKDKNFASLPDGKPAFLACCCCKCRNGGNDVCVLSIYIDRPLWFLNI